LTAKYGEPKTLDPREAVWEDETTRMSLERPLTVKYIDLTVFNQIIADSKLESGNELKNREEFLSEF
jgi:hypothetical protein